MKDFSVSVKISNNQLRARRLALGMNKRELSDAARVDNVNYGKLENLKDSPLKKNGEWRTIANDLAYFHKCLPEDLFPKPVMLVKKSEVVGEFDLEQLPFASLDVDELPALLPSPEEEVMNKSLITKALEVLTPKEKKVISERFGLEGEDCRDQRDIANSLGVSHQYIQIIQKKAMKKMRWYLNHQKMPQSVEYETKAAEHDKLAMKADEEADLLEKSDALYYSCNPYSRTYHDRAMYPELYAKEKKNRCEYLRNLARFERDTARRLRNKATAQANNTSSGKTYNG